MEVDEQILYGNLMKAVRKLLLEFSPGLDRAVAYVDMKNITALERRVQRIDEYNKEGASIDSQDDSSQ
jgi:hypothetical protein